ncbi:hypothetical protein [Arvimicrobium flavum]|uniref:hypothetical protein n=1 Tax=Arvimicrobium flavum TaxID=3393320 RepID=UPI00237C1758|nr:hypothetical protein [Mesorhizobium shangrilense]
MTQTKEVDQGIHSHRRLDLAVIVVLAGVVSYYFVTYTLPAAGGGYLVWICIAVLIATTAWVLGQFYGQEAEIDLLRLETVAHSKSRDRLPPPDEEDRLRE